MLACIYMLILVFIQAVPLGDLAVRGGKSQMYALNFKSMSYNFVMWVVSLLEAVPDYILREILDLLDDYYIMALWNLSLDTAGSASILGSRAPYQFYSKLD